MNIIPQVVSAMQTVLTTVSDAVGRATGFIKRQRKLSGSKFVQTLVFGWLANPQSTLDELSQTAATLGVNITPQALEQRFTPEACETLKQVLDAAIQQMIAADPQSVPLLERFNGVYIQDSSWVSLPSELAFLWQGCGGGADNQSSVKIQLSWEILTGALHRLNLQDGKTPDQRFETILPKGSLRLSDLGYFSLNQLQRLSDEGVYWLSRTQAMCAVFDDEGTRQDLAKCLSKYPESEIQLNILLGVKARLPCRLLALSVSEEVSNKRRRTIRKIAKKKGRTPSKTRLKLADWTILITNAQPEKLNVKEAMVLYTARWQIELLFKLWKNHGYIDEWRSEKPYRILCEFYAKLIAMIIQHWIMLTGCSQINRSFTKAAKTIAKHALNIANAFAEGTEQLTKTLKTVAKCLKMGCKIYKRRKQPNTYQLLLEVTDESGFSLT